MNLFVSLDPADLPRFRAQTILKSCRLGSSQTRVERGPVCETEDFLALRQQFGKPLEEQSIQTTRSPIGGAKWRAEMSVESAELDAGDKMARTCRVGFHLIEGGMAPLAALLMGLADRVPLQLANGSRWDAAFEQLRDGPPPPVKAKAPSLAANIGNAHALKLIARASLAHLMANHHCLLATGAPESIHQMRVALRRLRSAMSLFKIMLQDPQSQDLAEELRWMQGCLGMARDGDVLMSELLAPLDQEFHGAPGFDKLMRLADERRKANRQVLQADMSSPRFNKCLLRLACWIEEVGRHHPLAEEPVKELALATLDKRYKRVKKQMALFHSLDEEERHRVRIQVKKLRYSIDFFGGIISDRRAAKMTAQLAEVQEAFGQLNDIASGTRLLQSIAERAPAPEVSWAAGLVAGWHRKRVDDLLNQAWTLWHELERTPPFWKVAEN